MESDQVAVHETDLTCRPRRFLLNEQLIGPDGAVLDEGVRVRKIVRTCAEDGLIRKMFADSGALLLEVTSSRKYTRYETEHSGLASLLHAYFLSTKKDWEFLDHLKHYGGRHHHTISVTRKGEFNYRLERRSNKTS